MVDGDGFDARSEWRFVCKYRRRGSECARLLRKEMLHFGVGARPVAALVGRVHVLEEDSNWMLKAVAIVAAMDQSAAGRVCEV